MLKYCVKCENLPDNCWYERPPDDVNSATTIFSFSVNDRCIFSCYVFNFWHTNEANQSWFGNIFHTAQLTWFNIEYRYSFVYALFMFFGAIDIDRLYNINNEIVAYTLHMCNGICANKNLSIMYIFSIKINYRSYTHWNLSIPWWSSVFSMCLCTMCSKCNELHRIWDILWKTLKF